ncbi:MAG: helix-turn-helix domain-containing protein [Phycisphaera sp.]|nr:helix-turn-helix domain-containing protein [Phycisphaera sp.]
MCSFWIQSLAATHPSFLTDNSPRRQVLLALGWYARNLHQGVAAYAREKKWRLNIEMDRVAKLPEHWQGNGVICVLGMDQNLDDTVKSWGVPTVSIGPVAAPGIPRVHPDNAEIGRLAYEHFFTRGYRNFAYYRRTAGPGEMLRLEGFKKHVERGGHSLNIIDGYSMLSQQHSVDKAAYDRWLTQRMVELPKPLAVFAEYDDRAIEVIEGCASAGLKVPEQVAVLGVDDDQLRCEFAPVPLSSIDDDQQRQGYEAARLLDTLLDGQTVPEETQIAPRHVVTRVSTDILAINHPKVAEALRLIWNHYKEPLTAGDVAEAIAMSGRRLHDAFLKHVGRTISQEIKRRRIEHAKRLLAAEPPMKMEAVAWESGFTSADRMAKVFVSITGQTPSAYRKRLSPD